MKNDEKQQLAGKPDQRKSLVQFFRESPFVGIHLDLGHEREIGRAIDLGEPSSEG